MKSKSILTLLVFLILALTGCGGQEYFPSELPPTLTPTPLYRTDTPAAATDTPTAAVSPTATPGLPISATDTPVPPAAQWWQVYFTDPQALDDPNQIAGSIEEKLIQLIDQAQTSIHIASFEFNLTPVAEALIAAKNRGVDVKWVTDDKNGLGYDSQPGRGQFALLTGAGIEVRDDRGRTSLMHNKFWIFDRQIVWTGSTNVTVNGIFKQNNNVLVIHSPEVAVIYEREFDELWNGQFGPRAPSAVNNQWTILDGTPIQILFSAEDHAIDNLIALVNDAQMNIRFLAFSFTDYPLAKAMLDRAAAGVDVRGVFETFGSSSAGSELKTFWCAKTSVRQDGNPSFLHDKIIIIDKRVVVTGSLNFSSNADEANEENVVILDNPEIAALYLQEFDKLWNQAHDVAANAFTCQ